MRWICINCAKEISPEEFYCPYCGYQQYIDGFNPGRSKGAVRVKKQKIKISKSKPVLSNAELLTGYMKRDDPGFLAFLIARIFGA